MVPYDTHIDPEIRLGGLQRPLVCGRLTIGYRPIGREELGRVDRVLIGKKTFIPTMHTGSLLDRFQINSNSTRLITHHFPIATRLFDSHKIIV